VIVRRIPYLTADGKVAYGSLAYPITVSGDRISDDTGDHRIWFIGVQPCDEQGRLPGHLRAASCHNENLVAGLMISLRPPTGYPDQYAKVTSYSRILSHPAHALDPTVTATPGARWDGAEDGLPFVYRDTATSRTRLSELNGKFRGHRTAIVGLGGTGSYILDTHAVETFHKVFTGEIRNKEAE
jgi:hypothetical protein